MVGVEDHGVDLNTESGDVLLLKLACQMSLDESSLADTTVTNKNELILSYNLSLSFHFYIVFSYASDGLCYLFAEAITAWSVSKF